MSGIGIQKHKRFYCCFSHDHDQEQNGSIAVGVGRMQFQFWTSSAIKGNVYSYSNTFSDAAHRSLMKYVCFIDHLINVHWCCGKDCLIHYSW